MDQDQGRSRKLSERPRHGSPLAVSSRRRAFDQLRAIVDEGDGQAILITGEPGAGKTWLAHELGRCLPPSWMSTYVDLTGAMNALDFLHLLGHSLGIPLSSGVGAARARLQSILHDDDADGRRWVLLIDDSHRGSQAVWEEIEAVVNESGRSAGFAAIVVLGDTEFVRRLAAGGLRGFASTVCLHLHLPPLDVDEARELLKLTGHDGLAGDQNLENLHRDSQGNAAGLLRLARTHARFVSQPAPDSATHHTPLDQQRPAERSKIGSAGRKWPDDPEIKQPETRAPVAIALTEIARSTTPSLLPAKPPIRIEDGLVEVGWEGDLESEYAEPSNITDERETVRVADSTFDEQLINDPYAALQAWSEWTGGQASSAGSGVAVESIATKRSAEPVSSSPGASRRGPAGSAEAPPAAAPPGVRVEAQHDFAPYSQLFTRLRPSNQP